jgi:hypothetical protein
MGPEKLRAHAKSVTELVKGSARQKRFSQYRRDENQPRQEAHQEQGRTQRAFDSVEC